MTGPTYCGECPSCSANMSGHMSTDGDEETVPLAGDVTVCAYCLEPLTYAEESGRLRLTKCLVTLMPKEQQDEIRKAIRVLREFKRRNPGAFQGTTR